MAEYWLISAPGDKTMQQTWETMNNVTSKQNNLCVNYKFHIPDLKVSPICSRLVEKDGEKMQLFDNRARNFSTIPTQ